MVAVPKQVNDEVQNAGLARTIAEVPLHLLPKKALQAIFPQQFIFCRRRCAPGLRQIGQQLLDHGIHARISPHANGQHLEANQARRVIRPQAGFQRLTTFGGLKELGMRLHDREEIEAKVQLG